MNRILIYVSGLKSSETSYIPENLFIFGELILLEASVPDKVSASLWLSEDVIMC